MSVRITIDAKEVEAKEGQTVLQAADKAGIYIPRLCSHPDLVSLRQVKSVTVVFRGADRFEGESAKEYEGCKLCLVEVSGRAEPVTSCDTVVEAGMGVVTVSERLKRLRRENLTKILRDHPHACLTCAQTSGCPRTQCSANVPEVERCCQKLGNCELQRVAEFIGVPPDLPRYVPKNLPVVKDEPLLVRDYNLCIGCARCVRACGALRGIEALGFTFQNGQVVVGTVKEGLADSGCKFCGACVAVCPTGALTDKDITPADREKKLVPCKSGCPCGIDVPAYVRYIRDGDYKSAARVVLEKVPFLFTLGYVCFHPCEAVCRRGEVNEVISICALKRFAAENDGGDYENRASSAPTGKKVAIIGAGPAGLTAAYYLARKGHNVTVYDSGVEAGGMLRYGIPQYRLPKGALEKDLRRIARAGVSIKTGVKIDSLADVSGQFDAVLLSVGAQAAKRLMIEGVDLQSVYFGIELLRKKALGELRPDFFGGKRVLVIGGGNVALDCARTALRVGAENVQVACLESEEDMPAHDWEIEDARAEGIGIHPCWGPTRIRGCDGKVVGVDFVCCISVFDSAGVFCPAFDRSKTKSLDCDAVIIAVGQVPDLSLISGSEITVGKYGTVEADSESGKTRTASVFAAGEAVNNPGSVVEAVASGRRVASAIDRCLGGDGDIEEQLIERETPDQYLGREEGFAEKARTEMDKEILEKRIKNFSVVEKGLTGEAAKEEASRCLQCDLRLLLSCPTLPPEKWLELNEENIASIADECEGVYQLLDESRKVIAIKGTPTLKRDLMAKLRSPGAAKFFSFEEDPMYSKRESELIAQHLAIYGKMPQGEELEDLF